MLKTTIAALAGLLIASNASAQGQNCYETLEAYRVLSENHGEFRHTSGFDNRGMLVEMWGNPETGSWTALVTHPEGMSCVVAHGSFFTVDKKPEPAGLRL